jgi:DNA-binding transcriptional MerR regulator
MTGTGGDGPPVDAVWTAGQVARHLGIAESTLRSWHRRYRIGPDNTPAGSYRRYGRADVSRLSRMRDLVRAGVLPSDAARDITGSGNGPTGTDRPPEDDVAEALTGARLLDTQRCRTVLGRSLDERGVQATWNQVCRPALAEVNEGRFADPACVSQEHVLSWAISSALQRVARPVTAPVAVLACTAAEYHTLPLEALAAALGERDTSVCMVGAATPVASLVHVVATVRPDSVVLWSQQQVTATTDALSALAATGTPRSIIAGPGWQGRAPEGVQHCASLTEAVALLAV